MAEEEHLWRFLGSEGCALCDGLDEYYESEPIKPHPKCQCHIIAPGTRYEEAPSPRPWTSEHVNSVHDEGGETVRQVVIVTCWDGSQAVELYDAYWANDDPRGVEMFEVMEDEMEAVAERLTEEECPERPAGAGDPIT